MSSILIRGAWVREYKSYNTKGGQRTIDISMSATWSKPVCDEMGWEFEPQGFSGGKLEGKLHGMNMILEAVKKELRDYAFDITISQVDDFKLVCKLDGEGNIDHRELQFTVVTVADDAAAVLDNWQKHIGDERAQCKIVFSKEEQTELGEGGEPADKPRGRKKQQSED